MKKVWDPDLCIRSGWAHCSLNHIATKVFITFFCNVCNEGVVVVVVFRIRSNIIVKQKSHSLIARVKAVIGTSKSHNCLLLIFYVEDKLTD